MSRERVDHEPRKCAICTRSFQATLGSTRTICGNCRRQRGISRERAGLAPRTPQSVAILRGGRNVMHLTGACGNRGCELARERVRGLTEAQYRVLRDLAVIIAAALLLWFGSYVTTSPH